MKKFLQYFLIIITLIEIFSPSGLARAESDILGRCDITNISDEVLQAPCEAIPGTWNGSLHPEGLCKVDVPATPAIAGHDALATRTFTETATQADCIAETAKSGPGATYTWNSANNTFGYGPLLAGTPPTNLGQCSVVTTKDNLTKTQCNTETARAGPRATSSWIGGSSRVSDTKYMPLAPLPGIGDNKQPIDTAANCAFGSYLNTMIKLIIGLLAVGAVVMIVIGGIEYMTSELVSSKEGGKDRIKNALLGLVIALAAYTILNTINPKLLNSCLDLPKVTIEIKDEPEVGINAKTVTAGTVNVTNCDESQLATTTVFGKSVRVYKGVIPSLQRIDAKWKASGGDTYYKVNVLEGYVCRDVTNKPGYKSAHAFGLAIDINPDTNKYTTNKASAATDMKQGFVDAFMAEGWSWGGSWTNIKDPMHFSCLSAEKASCTFN